MARLLMNAIVKRSESKIASFIWVAASTLPPNVSMSKITANAPLSCASLSSLDMYGGKPKSIVPYIGIR